MLSTAETFLSANWVAILVGVAGAVATVVVYLVTRRVMRPTWCVRTTDLVSKRTGELSGLSVKFNAQEVSDLSVSTIVFFNNGSDPIRHHDIAPAAPLKLFVKEGATILDSSIVVANNPANRVAIRLDVAANQALIDFDYLGAREGAVFDVVHFGGNAAAGVTGIVIGARLAYQKGADPDPVGFVLGLVGGLLTLGAAAFVANAFFRHTDPTSIAAGVIVVGVFALFGVYEIRYAVQLKRLELPLGLRVFYERRYR